MRIFVKAKHWQIFIALVICTVLPPIFILRTATPFLFEASIALYSSVYFGWIFSVGNECNNQIPKDMKRSPIFMLAGLIYATFYTIVATMVVASIFESSNPVEMQSIIPFHLAAMACIFYSLGYAANRLVTLQRGQSVTFLEYSGPFFMFWLFPLGIWFIQPQVNILVGDE